MATQPGELAPRWEVRPGPGVVVAEEARRRRPGRRGGHGPARPLGHGDDSARPGRGSVGEPQGGLGTEAPCNAISIDGLRLHMRAMSRTDRRARRRPPAPTGGHRGGLHGRGRCGDGAGRRRRRGSASSRRTRTVRDRRSASTGTDRPVVRVSHFSATSTRRRRDRWPAPGLRSTDARAFAEPTGARRDRPASSRPRATRRRARRRRRRCRADGSTLIEGRLPAPCLDGRRMRGHPALRGRAATPTSASPGRRSDLELTIVGRGRLDRAVPFGVLDQRGPVRRDRPAAATTRRAGASPAVLLVTASTPWPPSPALERTGRTYVWTAPLVDRRDPSVDGEAFREPWPRRDARPVGAGQRVHDRQPDRHASPRSSPGPMPRAAGCCSSARSASRSCWPSPSSSPSSCATTSPPRSPA